MPGNPTAHGARTKLNYYVGKNLEYTGTFSTYLALLTANVADNVEMTSLPELTTPGYSRQVVTWTDATLARPSVISNSGIITFGPVTQDVTVPITHAVLVTVPVGTSGKVLYKWQLDSPQQPVNGQALQIAVAKLSISES
ncbi:phage tail fiber protein [Nonomuraea sp. SYSU D8015]|uniref:phage tail fiber protein n=1 Tax=Nonomuraea sp. SYSU D8015 TaxID=2593644 RepID=UPI001660A2C5|nr:hypothetical protein [Nonomuraea sp. SYSU D8015]